MALAYLVLSLAPRLATTNGGVVGRPVEHRIVPSTPPSSDGIFVRDNGGILHGPYQSEDQAHLIAASQDAQVVCLDARPIEIGRAVSPGAAAPSALWFVRCPDGLIRGPLDAESMRRMLMSRNLPANTVAFVGRPLARPQQQVEAVTYVERPGEQEEDPWKTTWRKHLRPHRWRATRATMKLGKSAAKSVSSVAPIIKTWEDEEAEWAAMVTKAHSQVRIRPPPPPPPPSRRGDSKQNVRDGGDRRQQQQRRLAQQQFRSVDASKQLDPSAAWRDDAREARKKQLKRIGTTVGVVTSLVLLIGAALAFDLVGSFKSLFASVASGDFIPDRIFDSFINLLLRPANGLRHTR